MKARIVENIEDFKRTLGLDRRGVLLENDLDVVENDTELAGRKRRDAEVLCTLAANSKTDVLETGHLTRSGCLQIGDQSGA